ncbi:valacyclovir hydrolase-like isoform X2 [Daktulosphaira vitifoliae]|nr:valacyclovir hydrolase-like isoform X2 [Daktulosphaira vitifoliae]
MNSKKIFIKDVQINYILVGNGPKKIIFLPGALGNVFKDFVPQINNLNRNKYTIIVWDPPGYGLSRPPIRDYSTGFFYRDADYVLALMKELNIHKFSLVGWCHGGVTALIAASKATDAVQSVVTLGTNAFITEKDMQIFEEIQNVENWLPERRQPFLEIYGETYFTETWSAWVDAFKIILKENQGELCSEILHKIKVPTLIVHGAKDPLISIEHALYLKKKILQGS